MIAVASAGLEALLGSPSISLALLQFTTEDSLRRPEVVHVEDVACSPQLPQHQHALSTFEVGTLGHFFVYDVVLPVYVHDGTKASLVEFL